MMWNNFLGGLPAMSLSPSFGGIFATLLVPFMLWSLFWKGYALWKAAKNDSKVWFIILLVVNTIGILEILYIFVFGKGKKASKKK